MNAPPPNFRFDETDWTKLTLGEQIQHLELEGYVVIPDLLSAVEIARFKQLIAPLETVAADYSDKQRGRRNIHWEHPDFSALVAHPPTVRILEAVMGEDLVFLGSVLALSLPGHPGISLHTDGQPWGSKIFGYSGSCPVQVRVLYYLDDLTADVSPFLVVPRSHLSLHADANPYTRYSSHPEQVAVPAKAGSAVLLNHRCFHGNCPNVGQRERAMLAYLYRPAWAGPVEPKIEPWPGEKLAALPPKVRRFFSDPNARQGFDFNHPNKPPNMRSEAPGIAPSRWQRV
jgi:ectoine hydroxylase-related dioxygenase (phytanoyl-CoA dioxygenase family)